MENKKHHLLTNELQDEIAQLNSHNQTILDEMRRLEQKNDDLERNSRLVQHRIVRSGCSNTRELQCSTGVCRPCCPRHMLRNKSSCLTFVVFSLGNFRQFLVNQIFARKRAFVLQSIFAFAVNVHTLRTSHVEFLRF